MNFRFVFSFLILRLTFMNDWIESSISDHYVDGKATNFVLENEATEKFNSSLRLLLYSHVC